MLPVRSCIVPLCVAMCAYPTNVSVPPPAMQLTVGRVVGLALILRCITSSEIRHQYKFLLVDVAATIYFGLLLLSQIMNTEAGAGAAINKQAGFFISAFIPFFCVRFLVVNRDTLYVFLRGFLWTAFVLAFFAIYQSKTGDSPFRTIMQNGILWREISFQWAEIRKFVGMPLYRASAPFQQCIMFGWFFAIQVPWCTNLYFEKMSLNPWVFALMMLPVGTIATVSSGPMMMVSLSFVFLAMFPIRRFWKPIFGSAFGAVAIISATSKRGLMEIVSSFGLDPASGYYRVNLMNYTLNKSATPKAGLWNPMEDHWVWGYGMIPPAYDEFRDLCIQWIFLTVYNGLVGCAGFYLLVICCSANLWRANKKSSQLRDHWLCWSLFAVLIASMLAMQLVALFAEMFFIYHMFLALCANTYLICGSQPEERVVGVLAEMDGKQVLLRYRLKPGQRLGLVRPRN